MKDGHSKKRKCNKKKDNKLKKPLGWDCGGPGHLKHNCLNPKKKKKIDPKKSKSEREENFAAMISKVNMTQDDFLGGLALML